MNYTTTARGSKLLYRDVAMTTPVSKAPHLTSLNILLASNNLLSMRNQGIRIHENDQLNTRYCKLAKGMDRLSHPPDQTVFD
jgi:hypothetical protein